MKHLNCIHASPLTPGCSRCALGFFDGRPTFGQCVNYCHAREPREPDPAAELVTEQRRLSAGGCCGTPAEPP